MISLIYKIFFKIKKKGFLGFVVFISKKINPFKSKVNPFTELDFINYEGTFYSKHKNTNYDNSISFLVPNFVANGSGGHLNIFRLASHLEKMGYQIFITIVEESHFKNGQYAKEIIEKYYIPKDLKPINFTVNIGREELIETKYAVATQWKTAYTLKDFQSTEHKFYFVQDYEPYFYSKGSEYYLAENTYKFGFEVITAGSWLSKKLSKEHGSITHSIGFSYDRNLYSNWNLKQNPIFKIFFYARPSTPRRGFEIGLLIFQELFRRNIRFEVIFAGADVSPYDIQFPYKNLGNLPIEELNSVYNSVDLGLILSFTNLSLLPYEMMACGCPILINLGSNNEWGLNEEICFMEEIEPKKMANKIIEIFENPEIRKQKIQKAIEYIDKFTWKDHAQQVYDIFKSKI